MCTCSLVFTGFQLCLLCLYYVIFLSLSLSVLAALSSTTIDTKSGPLSEPWGRHKHMILEITVRTLKTK